MKCFIAYILYLSTHLASGSQQHVDIQTVDNFSSVAPHLIDAALTLKQITDSDDKNSFCLICEQVVDGIISLRRSNASRDVMKDYLNRLCILYSEWGKEGCKGRVDIETDTILYIIDRKADLKPARFCGIYFQAQGCIDSYADSWSIPLPPKPATSSKTAGSIKDDGILRILHLTDVHLDPLYVPGSNAKCAEPLCCESGVPANDSDAAGYWGDYNVCDMPWHTFEEMMDRIRIKHKNIDWIYFTGDIVSHRTWASTIQSNSESIKLFYILLDKTFPNTTIFPILGNHEAHPGDYYAPENVEKTSNVSTQWLLDLSANQWAKWLPNNTQETIKKGGFYTVLVKPGFRIIALNSNVCYTANLWLTYENLDTYDQLHWLVDVLAQAENKGEIVHILSHIPSGDSYSSCVKIWSREFKKIILRFSDVIGAQFNGHTHMDEFKLFFGASNEVEAIAYNGASFATFVGSNPNYRTYEVDSVNMTVVDYNEYTFNLTEANKNASSRPDWYKLYSFKEAYGLSDLSLKSLENLHKRMTANDSDNPLVDQYFKYLYRNSDVYIKEGCDKKCKRKLVCLIGADETSRSINC